MGFSSLKWRNFFWDLTRSFLLYILLSRSNEYKNLWIIYRVNLLTTFIYLRFGLIRLFAIYFLLIDRVDLIYFVITLRFL